MVLNYMSTGTKNSVPPLGQTKSCVFKQQLVLSKIILYMELQVLVNLDTHWENYVNIWYFADVQFYFTDSKGYVKYCDLYSLLFWKLW